MDWQQQSDNGYGNPSNHDQITEDQIWPAKTFTSDWTFSLGTEAPVFPQSYSGYPARSAWSTKATPATAENPFDMNFGDISIWDEWDNFEDNNNDAGAHPGMSIDESTVFSDVGQLASESGPLLTTPPLFATLSPTVPPSALEKAELSLQDQELSSPARSSAFNSKHRNPSTTIYTNPQVSSSGQRIDPKFPPPRKRSVKSPISSGKNLNVRPTSRSLNSPNRSPKSVPTRYRTTSANITANYYPTPASTERSATSPPSTSTTSRGLTEQKYRARVNDQFTALLESIPKDSVEGSSESLGKVHPEKPVSKIEVLDLAQKHINMLERQQAELKEEGVVLKGQLTVYQKVFQGMGGQLMP